jgi:hypothetical protein
MAAADQKEYELFQVFLMTGGREKEVQFACWPDVSSSNRTFSVREKRDLGYTPKDLEEGEIPLQIRWSRCYRVGIGGTRIPADFPDSTRKVEPEFSANA